MPYTSDAEKIHALEAELAQVKAELNRKQDYHQLILDSATDYAIVAADLTGRIIEWSQGAVQLMGWSREEALGQSLHLFFTEADRANAIVEKEIGTALNRGRAADNRWHLRRDGSTFWASGQMMPITQEGQFIGVVKVVRDLTQQVALEQAYHNATSAAEKHFAALADAMPQLVWTADKHGNEGWFNARWYALAGMDFDQLKGGGWTGLIHPDHREDIRSRLQQSFVQQKPFEETFALQAREGGFRWFLARALPVYDENGGVAKWFGTCTDVDSSQIELDHERGISASLQRESVELAAAMVESTEVLRRETVGRKAAEDQVQQLQKMEALGQLTGGIAHDFNNMLTLVIGALDLVKLHKDRQPTRLERYCDIALDGARRAAALTHRLLAFSRQLPLTPQPVNLNKLTASLADLLNRTLGDHIRFENVQYAGLWFTHADLSQLENIVVNLAVNARDAMPNGGRLTIETANIYLDDHYAQTHGIKPGQYVLLAVTDTGSGIEPAILDKIFNPFFTTKEVGKGTGLGLSQVYGFVKQSGGHINVYSEVGTGTTIKLYFPRYFGETEAASNHNAGSQQPPELIALPGETLLVVEDDPAVRELSVEVLNMFGYRVLEADSGQAALRVLADHPQVALLFTDVMMANMTGRQLADQATALYPHLKVLYTTGYTRNAIVHNGTLDQGVNFLPKPFSVRELGAKVRAVLNAHPRRNEQ